MSEILIKTLKDGKFYSYPQRVVCLGCGYTQQVTVKNGQEPDSNGYIKVKLTEIHSEECKNEEK